MSLALALLKAFWKPIAALAFFAVIALALYHFGAESVRREWAAQNLIDSGIAAQALADQQKAEREQEQAWQAQLEKVQTDATQRLEQARTDAAGASAAATRLREQVAKLLAGQRTASTSARAPGSSPAGPDACGVLAQLLDKSVIRNGRLAEIADTAIAHGNACEASYNSIRQKGVTQ